MMDTQQQYGVVPSLDDLEWVWEMESGVLFPDSLPFTVLPSLHKPSIAFVEHNSSIDNGFVALPDSNLDFNHPAWQPHHAPFPADLFTDAVCEGSHKLDEYTNDKLVQLESASPEEFSELSNFYDFTDNGSFMEVEHTESDGRRTAESEYSASYSESGADFSVASVRSEEEIFEEIQRECAEIERRSSSPEADGRRRSKKASNNRQKELNRRAAAKYREKKRSEREAKHGQLRDLEDRNRSLKSTQASLEGEIKYLKELIKEIHGR